MILSILRYLKNPRALIRTCAILFFTGAIVGVCALGYEVHTPHTAFSDSKKIQIAPGLGSRMIGALLRREGIIRSKWAFVTYVSLRNEASDLKPGAYVFHDDATIADISRELIAGAAEQSITIPEGWNAKEIGMYLSKQGITPQADFEKSVHTYATSTSTQNWFPFLKEIPPKTGLDGYLFPDTYRFSSPTPANQVVLRMLQNFNLKFSDDLRAEAIRQHRTMFEIITIASLIEKEVALDRDREIVSGILWKRLANDIPLQVDATIAYITGRRNSRIPITDTRIDSPYNTYRYRGLPKGPISNPGLSAIHAALYPKKSPYLYYLSAPDGRTIFSRTLEEHNRAKARYLKM